MTKFLFIDTETTGPDPRKARPVEIAAVFFDNGPHPELLQQRWSTLIRQTEPIPPEAIAIHGITDEMCEAEGIPEADGLAELTELVLRARSPSETPYHSNPPGSTGVLVAHNLRYDLEVLASAYARTQARFLPLNYLTPFCTMVAMTDHCKLPGRYGKYKWPRLSEAYDHLYGPGAFDTLAAAEGGAHRALFDAERCRDIYLAGSSRDWWKHD